MSVLYADSILNFQKSSCGKYHLAKLAGDIYEPLCPTSKTDKKFLECMPPNAGKSAKYFKRILSAGNVNSITGKEYYHRISGIKTFPGKSYADDVNLKLDNALLVEASEEKITVYVFSHKFTALKSLFNAWKSGAAILIKEV